MATGTRQTFVNYFIDKFLASPADDETVEAIALPNQILVQFKAFVAEELKNNPPATFGYGDAGTFMVTLQDHTELLLADAAPGAQLQQMGRVGVPISKT